MAKKHWTFWTDDDRLKETIDQMLEQRVSGAERSFWHPRADICENDHQVVIQVELPGLTITDVNLDICQHELVVSGMAPQDTEHTGYIYQALERSYGPFARKFELPMIPDPATVSARMLHGLLVIHVPKPSPSTLQRHIPIHIED